MNFEMESLSYEILNNSTIRYNPSSNMVQLYYDSEWHDWVPPSSTIDNLEKLYLYSSGVVSDLMLGLSVTYASSSSHPATITWNSNNIKLYQYGATGKGYSSTISSTNKINLTNYNKIYIDYSTSGQVSSAYVAFGLPDYNTWLGELSGTGIKYFDISEVSGEYFLQFSIYYATTYIYAIYLQV